MKISFPGLGIGEFELNRVAIPDLFGKDIYWYGVIICIGLILALIYGIANCKSSGITQDDFLDIAIFTIPFAVISARLFYVLTDSVKQKSFIEVIAIWDGGISILGSIIGGLITIAVVCLIKKKNFLNSCDLICRCLIIGQIIGRIGNFINVEVYGIETTLPWGMYIVQLDKTVHPLFLYEMLWNTVGFVLLVILAKRKKFNGQVFFTYTAWYGFGRGFLELLRDREYVLGSPDNKIYISSIIAFSAFVVSVIMLVVLGKKNKQKLADKEYSPVFSEENSEKSEEENTEKAEEVE